MKINVFCCVISFHYQRKNSPVGAQKRLIRLKQKHSNWKEGYHLPQPGALITSADNFWPLPLPFHAALKIPQPNSRFINMPHPQKQIHSLIQTHIFTLSLIRSLAHLLPHTCMQACTHSLTHTHTHAHTHSLTLTHTHTHTHTYTDIFSKTHF